MCTLPPGVSLIGRGDPVIYGVLHVADLLPSEIRGVTFASGMPPLEDLQADRLSEFGFHAASASDSEWTRKLHGKVYLNTGEYEAGGDTSSVISLAQVWHLQCAPDVVIKGDVSIRGNIVIENCEIEGKVDLGGYRGYITGRGGRTPTYQTCYQPISGQVKLIGSHIGGSIVQDPQPECRQASRTYASYLSSSHGRENNTIHHRKLPNGTLSLLSTTVDGGTSSVALSVRGQTAGTSIDGAADGGISITSYQWVTSHRYRRSRRTYFRVQRPFRGNIHVDSVFCGAATVHHKSEQIAQLLHHYVEKHRYYNIAKVVGEGFGRGMKISSQRPCPADVADVAVNTGAHVDTSNQVGLYVREAPQHNQLEMASGEALSTGSVVAPGESLHITAGGEVGSTDTMVIMRKNGSEYEPIQVALEVVAPAMFARNIKVGTMKDVPVWIPITPPAGHTLMVPTSKTAANGTVVIDGEGILYTPQSGYYNGKQIQASHKFVDDDFVQLQSAWRAKSNGNGRIQKGANFIDFVGQGGNEGKVTPGTLERRIDISQWTGQGALVLRVDSEILEGVGGLNVYDENNQRLGTTMTFGTERGVQSIDLSPDVSNGQRWLRLEFGVDRRYSGCACRNGAWQKSCQSCKSGNRTTQNAALRIHSVQLSGQTKSLATAQAGDSFVYGFQDSEGKQATGTVTVSVGGNYAQLLFADTFDTDVSGWKLFELQRPQTPSNQYRSKYRLRRHQEPETGETQARIEGEGQNGYAGMYKEVDLGACQGRRPLALSVRYRGKLRAPTKYERATGTGDGVALWMWYADRPVSTEPFYSQPLVNKGGTLTDTNWLRHQEGLISAHLCRCGENSPRFGPVFRQVSTSSSIVG